MDFHAIRQRALMRVKARNEGSRAGGCSAFCRSSADEPGRQQPHETSEANEVDAIKFEQICIDRSNSSRPA